MKDWDQLKAEWKANIAKVYEQATPREVQEGIEWYANANEAAKALSKAHHVSVHAAAGVIAALSPNNRWERNLRDADTLITAYLNGDDILSVSVATYHKMREKAWAIMNERDASMERIADILNGQKIRSFFAGIMGNREECTIDGHARNIAYAERLSLSGSKFTIGKREYAALQQTYAEVGRDVGQPAYIVQAVTWVAWRRIHGIA